MTVKDLGGVRALFRALFRLFDFNVRFSFFFSFHSTPSHLILYALLVCLIAISLWKSKNGVDTSVVCFDCQADEFEESFGDYGPLSDTHKQVVEKWCSGIPGEGDDVEMGDEEEDDDSDGEESEGENGTNTGGAMMELEDSDEEAG